MPEAAPRRRAVRGGPVFDPAWLAPRHWAGWIAAGVAWLTWRLPRPVRDALAKGLGAVAYRWATRQRRIADVNLRCCFPEMDAVAREALIRAHFRLAIRVVLDYGVLTFGSAAAIEQRVQGHGEEHIRAAQAAGQHVIVLVVHALALDFGNGWQGLQLGGLGIYRSLANPVIDWLVARSRTRFKGIAIERSEGLRPVIRAIRGGQILVYLADEDLGIENAVFVPFFGFPKATLSTLGRLATICDAVVIPSITRFDAETGRYHCHYLPPLQGLTGSDDEADARTMNAAAEALIRTDPAQYMWTLRLFKTRPPGEPGLYR